MKLFNKTYNNKYEGKELGSNVLKPITISSYIARELSAIMDRKYFLKLLRCPNMVKVKLMRHGVTEAEYIVSVMFLRGKTQIRQQVLRNEC